MQTTSTIGPHAGVFAAMITPRRSNTIEIETDTLLEYLDRVRAAGVDGFVLLGSTGEFVHFDLEERMRATALAAKRSRLPFFVNASHSTFSGARDLAQHADDCGAAGVLATPPYFYPYGDREIEAFYCELADAVGREIPLYLYNLPQFAPAPSRDAIVTLLRSSKFAGIKDSSGDWGQFQGLLSLREQVPFHLFAGHEAIYAQALRKGAESIISGIASAVPELPVGMRRAAKAGNDDLLTTLDAATGEFLSWIYRFAGPVAVKEAAELRGWLRSTLASPLSPASQDELGRFRDWFSDWLPRILDLCAQAPA